MVKMMWFSFWLMILGMGQTTTNEWNTPWVGIPMQVLGGGMMLYMLIKVSIQKNIMDNNNPIVVAIVDETTCRIKSVHRHGDQPQPKDAETVVGFSKDDLSRLVEMAENIPGVGTLFVNLKGDKDKQ